MAEILHPMIYDGPKAEKRAEITGRLEPIVFKLGPLSEMPGPLFGKKYADVTEKEGRALQRRAPGLYVWPEGTQLGPQMVSRDEYNELVETLALAAERIKTLDEVVAGLVKVVDKMLMDQAESAKAAPAAAGEPHAKAPAKKAKAAPAAAGEPVEG